MSVVVVVVVVAALSGLMVSRVYLRVSFYLFVCLSV